MTCWIRSARASRLPEVGRGALEVFGWVAVSLLGPERMASSKRQTAAAWPRFMEGCWGSVGTSTRW